MVSRVLWNRVYLTLYGRMRWGYVHWGWHRCGTFRPDGLDHFLWIAVGPLDIRWHVEPNTTRRLSV